MEGGASLGDHANQAAKTLAELGVAQVVDTEAPLFPWFMQPVFDAFMDLNATRQSGFGLSPITYSEIKAWCDLYGVALAPYEVKLLKKMDATVAKVTDDGTDHRAGDKGRDGRPQEGRKPV